MTCRTYTSVIWRARKIEGYLGNTRILLTKPGLKFSRVKYQNNSRDLGHISKGLRIVGQVSNGTRIVGQISKFLHQVRPHRLFHPHFRALARQPLAPKPALPLRLAKLSPRPPPPLPPPPRVRPSRLQKSKATPPPIDPRCGGRHHDDPIQRRRTRPRRRRGVLVPAAPPALRVRRRVRLLPRLLLLPVPAAHLPGAARPGRGARRRARGEAPQAAVRPQPGVRAVPPGGVAHVPRRGVGVPGRGAPRRRLPLPQHHAALHRREPQQGGHPLRRHGAGRHVPRRAARGGGGARVRAARAQHPPAPDPRHRRPLQRAPDRRAGSHPRRRDQRPRRAPHHRRRRRQDPRARILLAESAGVGGLRDRHQPEEPVAQVQAVRRGRAERVGTKQPPPPPPPPPKL